MTGPSQACPCGGLPAGATFAECCGRFLSQAQWPATAEQLMRSRYTAFARGDAEHLWRTWHPRTRPEQVHLDEREWLSLTITDVVDGEVDDQMGIVGFVASWRQGSERGDVIERSAFVRRGGRWVYLAATPETPQ